VTDLGIDVSTDGFDVDEDLSLTSGRDLLVQDMLARLDTPRGALFYDDNYGYDLSQHVGEALGPADLYRIEVSVVAELLKDPRVEGCVAKASLAPISSSSATQWLRVTITIDDGDGPFDLVVDASKTSVELVTTKG
jgi:phage baseplate assembly protein W